MGKFETLDFLLQKNNGFLKTYDALEAGISKPYLGEYVRKRGLETTVMEESGLVE